MLTPRSWISGVGRRIILHHRHTASLFIKNGPIGRLRLRWVQVEVNLMIHNTMSHPVLEVEALSHWAQRVHHWHMVQVASYFYNRAVQR
jgi:hypothetical protein